MSEKKLVKLADGDRAAMLHAVDWMIAAMENLAGHIVIDGEDPQTQLESDIGKFYSACTMFHGGIFIQTTPIHFKE